MTKPAVKRASIEQQGNKKIIRINSSAIGLIQACERKADYILNQGYASLDQGSPAQKFGSAIHEALARYYQTPVSKRNPELLKSFWDEVAQFDFEDPKRNREVGFLVLGNYARTYQNDPWVVPLDVAAVESEFEATLWKSANESIEVKYFGTIDLIVENTLTGEIAVMDHKTGISLGKEFMQRWKPNHQLSGYIWALNEAYGMKTNLAIINGLQIAKTTQNVCRVESRRTDEEILEFKKQVLLTAKRMLLGLEGMSDGTTCSAWGGCKFLDACQTTPSLRSGVLESIKSRLGEESYDLA